MLAGKEFENATVENTIEIFKEAVSMCREIQLEYGRHRWQFGSIEEFIRFYNQVCTVLFG